MDVDQIRKRKAEAIDRIKSELLALEAATGCNVTDLEVRTIDVTSHCDAPRLRHLVRDISITLEV